MRYWEKLIRLTENNWLINLSIWLILLMPLLLYADVNNPFSFGRYVFLMFIALLLVVGVTISKKIYSHTIWWRHPVFWLTLTWLIIGIISASVGVNPHRSWWGTVSRSTGMFYYIGLWVTGWLFLTISNNKEYWPKIFSIMSWVGGISALYAILQQFNLPFIVVIISGGSRASALMGNPIFFGQLLLFTIFLTLYFVIASSGSTKWAYLGSLALQAIAIFMTASRGPLLALALAGLIWLIIAIVIYRKSIKFNWRWLAGGGGLAALALGLMWVFPAIGLARIFEIYNSSLQARLYTWQTAWAAIQDRALLGYGNDNAWYAMTKFYQPGLAGLDFSETIVDRAHNFVLDQMIANGWVGLILEIILLGYLLWILSKHIRIYIKQANLESAMLFNCLLAVVVAFFVANLTAFETVTTAIYGMVILVAIVSFTAHRSSAKIEFKSVWIWRILLSALAIGLIFFNFKYLTPAFRIGQHVDIANDAYRQDNYMVANKAYAKAQEIINPYRWSFLINYPGFARRYSILSLTDKSAVAMAVAEDGLRVATNIKKQEPDRVAIFMEFPILYTIMAYYNPAYTAKAQEAFENLAQEFPNHEYIYLNWARALMGVNKYKEAKQTLIQLADRFTITPTSFEFWRALVDIHLKSKDNQHIIVDLKQATTRKISFFDGDQDILRYVAGYLVLQKEWSLALYYQQKLVQLDIDDVQEQANLAAIYKELGDLDKAAEVARTIVKIDPTKLETTQQFLQSIGRTL
ncbi:O-antigen ligase family protein [Patescibacteria group bacterium]|nr:O-antigen ligase family protein [Patescibacteria group bacterium]